MDSNPVGYLSEYELRHLAKDLDELGKTADLHRLLALDTSKGRNAWFEAKYVGGNAGGFLADVSLAWHAAWRADDALGDGVRAGSNATLQARYALITASVNSLAKNLPPDLVRMAVQYDLLSPLAVLDLLRSSTAGPARAADVLVQLAPLPDILLEEAVTVCANGRRARVWKVWPPLR